MSRVALCQAAVAFAAAVVAIVTPASAAESVAEIATRKGISVRALLSKPGKPRGSVILLAGGHGNLAISPQGKIGWGAGNQLVRTRAAYAAAGFVTLVPDVAPDLKTADGGKDGYRWSSQHAADIGALVRHMRSLKEPVYLVGTSRAALSVANAAANLSGTESPDAIVITSGMIAAVDRGHPFAETKVGRLERIKQPVLLMYHAKDACPYTPASSAPHAKTLFKGAARIDVEIVNGGEVGSGDPCQAKTHHGFLGQDAEVVRRIAAWLSGLRKP